MKTLLLPAIVVAAVLGGCGGGDGGRPPPAPPGVATYSVGGQLTGLGAGKTIVVGDAGGETAALAANGPYGVRLPEGSRYDLSIVSQPAGQTCTITNGSGTVRGDITDIAIACVGDVATVIPAIPSGLAVTSGTKRFQFTWNAVADATMYRLLEDLDGAGPGGVSQVGAAVAANTASYAPPALLHTRLNAQYRVQACNAAGCSPGSLPVAPNLEAAIGYFKASNTDTGDFVGGAVALSADGSTLAVGARVEDSSATGIDGDQADNSSLDAGAVYVFVRDASASWTQQAYIKASNTGADDQFGRALALSADGSVLAVAAPIEASSATGIGGNQTDDSAGGAGAVYVFARGSGGTWFQQAYVKASNAAAFDWFGQAVSLSGDGNLLAVGAYLEESNATGIDGNQADNSAPNAGAVYLFRNTAGAWAQEAYVKPFTSRASTFFGYAVALSSDGSTLGVGAVGDASSATGIGGNPSDTSAFMSGAVHVFTHAGGAWSQQAYIKASNTGADDQFGWTLALSADGNTMAVGAHNEDSTGIGGDQSDNGASAAGAVYVFTRAGTAWSQQAYLKAANAGADDQFGGAVSLSADGDTLAIGASGESGGGSGAAGDPADNSMPHAGAAYLYTRSGGSWAQAAYLKAPNPLTLAGYGGSLALSGDGTALAVGSPAERSGATGVQGNQADTSRPAAGAVYLY